MQRLIKSTTIADKLQLGFPLGWGGDAALAESAGTLYLTISIEIPRLNVPIPFISNGIITKGLPALA